jgi:ABC-2 type transport system permease protein
MAMAVYRRGYQRYTGARTSHLARVMVLPRFAWRRIFEQRFLVVVLVVSFFWPLLCTGYVYLANHTDLWGGLGKNFLANLKINAKFFSVFMNVQSVFAMVLATIAGPGLIAPDLANNALPLYFSRPLSRAEYVAGRLVTLLGMLGLVTIVPALWLFAMQVSMTDWAWLSGHWYYSTGVFFGFLLWITLVSLVALAASAYVKWRVVAGALVLAFFFLLAGVAEMVDAIFRFDYGAVFNPAKAMNQIWLALLGGEPLDGPPASQCALVLGGLAVVLLLVVWRKLRPVEVIR